MDHIQFFLLLDESVRKVLLEGVNICSAFMFKFDTVKGETKVINQVVVPQELVHAVIVGVFMDGGIV